MIRFFFDVKYRLSVEHDYKGRVFASIDQAMQMADLIAMDVGCTRVDGSSAVEVQVRDPVGKLLGSVAVKATDSLAA